MAQPCEEATPQSMHSDNQSPGAHTMSVRRQPSRNRHHRDAPTRPRVRAAWWGLLVGSFLLMLGVAVGPAAAATSYAYVTQWGSLGTGNGQFSGPIGVATDSSGNVYVTDGGNNRIEKFNSSGTYLTQWGSAGTGNGQFSDPFDVAIDSSGNVYVTDSQNNRIEKFDSSGTYLTQWGSAGTGNGQFNGPTGVAVGSSG